VQATGGGSPQEVTSDPEEVEHKAVHRKESLCVFGGLESSNLSLALSGRLMGHFRSIVLVSRGAMNNRGQDTPYRVSSVVVASGMVNLTLPYRLSCSRTRKG